MRLDPIDEQVPDSMTLLKFCHMLKEHRLAEAMFRELSSILEESGVMMREGSVVDATVLVTPANVSYVTVACKLVRKDDGSSTPAPVTRA